jgi:hypothetical protein
VSQVEVRLIAFRETLTVLEKFLVKAVVSIPMAQDVVAIGLVQVGIATVVARMTVVAQQVLQRLLQSMGCRKQGRTL